MTEKSDQKQEPKQEIPNEVLVREVANIVFSNVKIYLNDKLRQLDEPMKDIVFVKHNVATLSTLLANKKLFTKEEFKSCHKAMIKSFGVVKQDGSMDGTVIITDYNFSTSGGEES